MAMLTRKQTFHAVHVGVISDIELASEKSIVVLCARHTVGNKSNIPHTVVKSLSRTI